MGRRFTVDEDGYYVGSVPELPGCHTQTQTLKTLMERIREAIELYLETVSTQATSK
jgi:predicted RNase H-like HicB family nuclease